VADAVRIDLGGAGQVEGGPTAAAPMFDVYLRGCLDDLRTA
jgi:hypothetical protein